MHIKRLRIIVTIDAQSFSVWNGWDMRSGFIVQSNATSVLCIVIIELAEVVGDELLGGAAAAAAVGHFPADA